MYCGEIARLRRRGAVRGKLGDGIASPEAMEFVTGKKGEGYRLDGRVTRKNRLAGFVLAGNDALDIHESSWKRHGL
jgi:hypothetical protein